MGAFFIDTNICSSSGAIFIGLRPFKIPLNLDHISTPTIYYREKKLILISKEN
jgi:hypothetical protein